MAGAGGAATDGGPVTCRFATLDWTGALTGIVNECLSGVFGRVADGGGLANDCAAPVQIQSTPLGLSFFNGECVAPPTTLGPTHRLRASRFGSYQFTLTARDTRGTFVSPVKPFTATASLAADGGFGGALAFNPMMPQCLPIVLSALGWNSTPVPANANTSIAVTATQAGYTGSILCDAGMPYVIRENASQLVISVQPRVPSTITVSSGGLGLTSSSNTILACWESGSPCSAATGPLCCSSQCDSMGQCQ
jgi:hypothetical protein